MYPPEREQVTAGIGFNYELRCRCDVNYDNYLIQNTRLQQINQVKGNGKK